jgi:uncharacterized protein
MPAVLTVDRTALSDYFASREDVIFAYLFGSHARGRTHALSDVDVAVFLDDGLDSGQRFQARLDIMGDLTPIVHTDEVDVAVLNGTPLALNYRVLRDGRLLSCRDRDRRIAWEARTISRYLDYKPVLDRFDRAIVDRARRGELSSGHRSHRSAPARSRLEGETR